MNTMQQQVAWGAGRPLQEDWQLSAQSDTEAYFGRLRKAREFSRRAEESVLRAGSKETAALWRVQAALHEAEVGNGSAARQNAMAALALAPGRDIRALAALTLARVVQAQKIADALDGDFPQNTVVQRYWLPSERAAIKLDGKNSEQALEMLKVSAPYELAQTQPFQLA